MSFSLFLTHPYFQQVLVTTLLVAVAAAIIGVFLVQRGMSLFGDGVAHMGFAGIAIGFVAGWMPLTTAIVVASIGALGVQELHRRGWARSDAALGIVYTASLALGVLLVSRGGSVPVDIDSYLFGSLVLSGATEFRLAAIVAATVVVTMTVLWRPFVLLTFGEERAIVQGVPARVLNAVFTLLTALTVVASVRVVGVLLVSGLVIIPASAAIRLARSMRQAVLYATGIAIASVLLGLFISTNQDLAPGATITLTAAGFFALSTMIRQ